ncbi:MAG: hypothetical protein K2X66_13860, partial [Cyanobacteria bacterium]|nr:hypothetical protein [Cyanobacteriota bacterium]
MSGSIGYPGAYNPALFQAPPSNYGPSGYNQGYPSPQGYPAPQGYPGGFDPNMGFNPGFQAPPVNNGYGLQIPGFGTPA